MGFSREHCQEALTHTNSIEQATEWILTHPPPAAPAAANEAGSGGNAGNSSNNQVSRAGSGMNRAFYPRLPSSI